MALTQIIEFLVASAVNCAGERRPTLKPPEAPPLPAPPADHVVLGYVIPAAPEVIALSPADRLRHIYILGATGSGKSNMLLNLIESDIKMSGSSLKDGERSLKGGNKPEDALTGYGRTFCVLDLRGDLNDRIVARLAQAGDPERIAERLLLLDLRQDEFTVGFNPLAGSGDPHSRAFHLLGVLRDQAESWGVQLEETLRNCLIALAETGWSLLEIEPLLSQPAFRREVMAGVSDDYVRAFFARYDQLSEEKQLTGWRLPCLNKVTPLLALPQLRRTFGQRQALDFRALLDGPPGQIVLISLAVNRLHGAAHLAGGLLISAIQNAVMARVDQPEEARVPFHFYVDEFETMATQQFETIIAEGRRFGCGLCLSHQNLSQVPAPLRQSLLNNVHTQLYFQTGAGDAADLVREIVSTQPPEEIRQTLMTQGVGEAYLVRRGQAATRLRVPLRRDPAAAPARVQALRDAALRRWGRPRAEIEQELAERTRRFGQMPMDGAGSSSAPRPSGKAGYDARAGYEVRCVPVRGRFLHLDQSSASSEVNDLTVPQASDSASNDPVSRKNSHEPDTQPEKEDGSEDGSEDA